MKRLLVYAALAFAVFSCTYGGISNYKGSTDADLPVSGANELGTNRTGLGGTGMGSDTTALNAGAVQPDDSIISKDRR